MPRGLFLPEPTGGTSPVALRRTFIKQRLERGTSAKAVRESYNALAALSPSEIDSRWGRAWRGLSGASATTPKEVHQLQSSLGRAARGRRREARETNCLRTEGSRLEAAILHLPEPTVDYQKASDAGTLYRATNDERYREVFAEGSP